ncbi:MAG: hypothetical protein AAFO80_15100, partial [Pseudomonadota bacterium]
PTAHAPQAITLDSRSESLIRFVQQRPAHVKQVLRATDCRDQLLGSGNWPFDVVVGCDEENWLADLFDDYPYWLAEVGIIRADNGLLICTSETIT